MIYIGIDPGLSGAVAFLYEDQAKIWDIPTILKGSGSVKQEINASAMFDYLRDIKVRIAGGQIQAALERVNSMPGQAASSTFSLGDSFGVCRATLASAGIPTTYVTPQSWKKHFNLSKEKEEARALAIKLYPSVELHLKKHIDRAESLLIATYLKHQLEK
jgi:crossover junction endodeoxyribonuclease RuvC